MEISCLLTAELLLQTMYDADYKDKGGHFFCYEIHLNCELPLCFASVSNLYVLPWVIKNDRGIGWTFVRENNR